MSEETKTADILDIRERGHREAYKAVCKVVDRDHEAGVEPEGIIDNVLAVLAKLAGVA